jgi:hypothetical protein
MGISRKGATDMVRHVLPYSMVAVLPVLFVVGCSDNGVSPTDAGDVTYPLSEGNSWVYESQFLDVLGLVLDRVVLDTVDVHYNLEIASWDTLADSLACFRFVETAEVDSIQYITSETYYGSEEDGLYCYAYRPGDWIGFAVGVTPRPVARPLVLFRGMPLSEVRRTLSRLACGLTSPSQEDTLIFEDPPVRALAYPLRFGSQWVYRQPDEPWAIDKRVVDRESIVVPAGRYKCYAVRWLIDFGDDGQWDDDIDWVDHYSGVGLVRRSLIFRDNVVTDPWGEPVDTLDIWEITSLASCSVE